MEIINLPQLVTQLLGFLLVLWILGRYAWPRVLGFIAERQRGIETDLRHAEEQRRQADALRAELEQELRAIEARARSRIQEAVSEGQRVAGEIKTGAQREATERIERALAEIERERQKAQAVLREDVVRLAIGTAEKILRKNLDADAQRRLVEEFVGGVRAGR